MASKQLKRTDVHRPGAIVPADYEYVGIYVGRWEYAYDLTGTSIVLGERQRLAAHMSRTGGTWATHEHKGTCQVCSARANYLAAFYHRPSNQYVRTGMDCAESIAAGITRRFQRFLSAKDAALKARSGRKKAEGVLANRGSQAIWDMFVLLTRPTTETLEGQLRDACLQGDEMARMALRDLWEESGLDPRVQPVPWDADERKMVGFVNDLIRFGNLFPAKWTWLDETFARIVGKAEKVAREDELAARRAAEKAAAADAPKGRGEYVVEVLSVKTKPYGGFSSAEDRLVVFAKHASGWTCWGTLPRGCDEAKKGDRIDLRATFTPADDDPKHAFFARPYGRIVEAAPAV